MKNIHVLPTDKPSRLILQTNGVLRLSEITFKGQIASGVTQNIYITNDEEIKDGDWAYHKIFGVGKITHIHGEYSFVSIKRNSTDGTITTPWRRNIPDIKKIILTTDQPSDSVQAIDDEFLEWFVKNPSCEFVEVDKNWNYPLDKSWEYKLRIIPKEQPKLTNVCIKCGVDLYYADNFACQEHPKNCKGIHLSEETLKERALKEEPKQEIKLEDVFNDEKKKGVKNLIDAQKQETLEEVAEKFYPGVDRQVDRMLFINGAKWQQEQDKNKYSDEKEFYKYMAKQDSWKSVGLIIQEFIQLKLKEEDKKLYSEEDLDMLRKFMIQEQNFSKSCLDVFIEQFKKK